MRVNPDNRLVADSLEADWNMQLRQLRQAERILLKTSFQYGFQTL